MKVEVGQEMEFTASFPDEGTRSLPLEEMKEQGTLQFRGLGWCLHRL